MESNFEIENVLASAVLPEEEMEPTEQQEEAEDATFEEEEDLEEGVEPEEEDELTDEAEEA